MAIGGAAGTGARWLLVAAVPAAGGFPIATLLANLAGAFLLGVVLTRVLARRGPLAASLLGTGGLGAMTTFSTFALETVDLLAAAPAVAAVYAAASLTLGPLAAAAGLRLGRVT